nr:type II secretion system protein [uncultured Marinobacter sp.]
MTAAPRSSGFTLVELVMVIILVGVLSVLGVGLFTRSSAFAPLLATQQLASATLLAQQAALAGNPANTLTVVQTAGEFRFEVGAGTGNPRVFTLPREGTSIAGYSGPLLLTFNDRAELGSGTDISIAFVGDSSFQTCISSLGAVYAGSCQ